MIAAQPLHVDSVTVDSVWNSDSASRVSRDCMISFVPVCSGKVDYDIELSVDSGKTWSTALILASPQISGNVDCGVKQHMRLRVAGPDRPGVVVRVKAGWWSLPDTAALFVSTPATLKSNHYIPDLYFHFDYVDTLRTNVAVDSFILLAGTGQTTLSYTPGDLFCVVRWTYDSGAANFNYDSSFHVITYGGQIHTSVAAVSGSTHDVLTWDVRANTFPWIETSQYQVTTTVYRGNTYTDTVIVSDVDGDKPSFTVTDTSGFGVQVANVTQKGDTTYGIITWAVSKTGTFRVSINVIDSVNGAVGYDTTLALTFKAQEKTLITSTPLSMQYGTAVNAEYRDTIVLFPDFQTGFTGQLLRAPSGMTLTGNVVTWTPAAAAVDSVVAVFSHPSYLKGTDTLKWAVSAVTSSKFVFWHKAITNGYNLQDCQSGNLGPCLPAGVTVFEGSTATFCTRLCCDGDGGAGFAIGNGPSTALSGRSAMFHSADLCDKQGTAIRAVLRAEHRDGWSGNAFNNEGVIIAKIGVIDMTVYRDVFYGGAIACSSSYLGGRNPVFNYFTYDIKFYVKPGNPPVVIPGLMAEEIVTIQAPPGRPADQEPSILDKQFFEIDITKQVQWILDRKGKDYVEAAKAGDYAIVFLVPNDATAGGTGKVNFYASSCNGTTIGSDSPWTQDGNTMHLYLEGDISPAP